MSQFVIEGGHKLAGEITPGGNKNEALPCIAATLLTDEPVILHNVPRIRDVDVLLNILRSLGGVVEELDSPNDLRITNKAIRSAHPDGELCSQLRASILLAGPLLARHGDLVLSPPGGDVIGRRRVEALGATVQIGRAYEVSRRGRLKGADFFLDEASVTATENIVMAAVLADGHSVLRNVASEPHVQGLCTMLRSMGATIEGVGSNTLHIDGTESLGGCEFTIGPDYLEVGSFIGLAACTDSDIIIRGAGRPVLRRILMTSAWASEPSRWARMTFGCRLGKSWRFDPIFTALFRG
jgi:UDP-N-acetylglucosamine 1-carboxyvinyltransferase